MQEIIINQEAERKTIALVEDGNLIEKYEETIQSKRMEGNIYIGKVQNVLPGMQAAFINIGECKNAFIHLKDIVPKQDVTKTIQKEEQERSISNIVKPGMPILVEVKRDSTNKKGARVSTHISLVSRYLVLMPQTNIITISQKINEEAEANRLLNIIQKNIPENMGAIVRTSSNEKTEEEIVQDLKILLRRWEVIQDTFRRVEEFPILVEKNNDIVKKLILDTVDNSIQRITVNSKELWKEITNFIKELGCQAKIEVVLREKENILDCFSIEEQIEKANSRKVWLKCGGFITIDKTEALTAIDVNSGKYTGNKSLEQTVLKVNEQASEEIARQIRLRDIGGIIVIDYIDMQEESHKKRVMELLEECLKKDRSKTQVLGFTKLNLLEMTRKHICSND